MAKSRLIGLFIAFFMIVMLFPSLNTQVITIGTHENATDIEIVVMNILPTIMVAFIIAFACILVIASVKEMGVV